MRNKTPEMQLRALQQLGVHQVFQALGTEHFCSALLALITQIISGDTLEFYYFKRSPSRQTFVNVAFLGGCTTRYSKAELVDYGIRSVTDQGINEPQSIEYKRLRDINESEVQLITLAQATSDEERLFLEEEYFLGKYFAAYAAFVAPVEEGLFELGLSRAIGDPVFSAEELKNYHQLGQLILPMLIKHMALTPPIASLKMQYANLQQQLDRQLSIHHIQLSSREREVCVLILSGCHGSDIAVKMNIAATSVKTYKLRAFAKMGVRTQQELFNWCLGPTHARIVP